MAGRTGYTAPTNGSDFDVPGDILDVYAHFDAKVGETVAAVVNLPASGNWAGRTIFVSGDQSVWVWSGSAWLKSYEDTGLLTPTLVNNWGDFGSGYAPLRYRRVNRLVIVSGMIKSVGTPVVAPGTTITTLPAGFRPSAHRIYTVWGNGGALTVEVLSDGRIVVGDIAATAARMSLNLPPFVAEA